MSGKGAGWVGVRCKIILLAACASLSFGCSGAWTEGQPDNGGGDGGGGGTGSQKPVATLAAFPASGDAPLTVDLDGSGCWSRTGGSLTYDWDFDGDNVFDKLGGAQTERHVFQTAGNFTVKLRVTDSKGNTNSATTAVHVSEGAGPVSEDPVVSLGVYPTSGPAPLKVTLDASGSWAKDGKPLSYEYDYDGDGTYDLTSAEYSIDHTYNAAGTYHPKLRVTDSGGHSATATTTLTVQEGSGGGEDDDTPVIGLNAYPRSGAAPLKVTLDASASWAKDGKPLHYDYDADGDGAYEISSDNYAEDYTYTAAGNYTPKVRVIDSGGHSATASGPRITVTGGGGGGGGDSDTPVIGLNAYPRSGAAPLKVTLDASASWAKDGKPLHYEYDVTGDGTYEISSDNYAEDYTYTTAGSHTPKLRVTDSQGHSATATGPQITVSAGGGGGGGGGEQEEGPVAVVIADPASGHPPLNVTFFAGMSLSIGSAIKQFDWDMDNDGTFELLNAGPEQTRSYSAEGTYYVNVRVTDYKGRTATGMGIAIVNDLL